MIRIKQIASVALASALALSGITPVNVFAGGNSPSGISSGLADVYEANDIKAVTSVKKGDDVPEDGVVTVDLQNGTMNLWIDGSSLYWKSDSANPTFKNGFNVSFKDMSKLTDISSLKDWSVSGASLSNLFSGCSALKDISAVSGWNVSGVSSFDSAFEGCAAIKNMKPVSSWDMSAASSANKMFKDCSSVQQIYIPNTLKSVGDEMYSGCEKARNVSGGNAVTAIGEKAFFVGSSISTNLTTESDTLNGYDWEKDNRDVRIAGAKVTLTLSPNYEEAEESDIVLQVDKDTEIDLSQNCFAREGFTQIGWSKSADAKDASIGNTYTASSDLTLYAVWKAADNNAAADEADDVLDGDKDTNDPADEDAPDADEESLDDADNQADEQIPEEGQPNGVVADASPALSSNDNGGINWDEIEFDDPVGDDDEDDEDDQNLNNDPSGDDNQDIGQGNQDINQSGDDNNHNDGNEDINDPSDTGNNDNAGTDDNKDDNDGESGVIPDSATSGNDQPGSASDPAKDDQKPADSQSENPASGDVIYTVIHRKMELDGKSYKDADTEKLKGKAGESVEPATKTYEGFTAPAKQRVDIKADGSTVVQYDYMRNKYDLAVSTCAGVELEGNKTGQYYFEEPIKVTAKVKKGYKWEKWSNDEKKETSSFSMPATSVSLTPSTSLIEYAITYDLDGGKIEDAPKKYNVESGSMVIPNPKKEGYTFSGWLNGSKKLGKDYSINEGTIGDISLIAKWTPNVYNIIFDPNGGEGSMPSQKWEYTSKVKLRDNTLTYKGYEFVSWNTERDGTGKKFANKGKFSGKYLEDVTLYAQWKKKAYRIVYELDGGTLPKDNPDTFYFDTPTFTIKNPIRYGYKFVGWTVNGSSRSVQTVTIQKGTMQDVKLKAVWKTDPNAKKNAGSKSSTTSGSSGSDGKSVRGSVQTGDYQSTMFLTMMVMFAVVTILIVGKKKKC